MAFGRRWRAMRCGPCFSPPDSAVNAAYCIYLMRQARGEMAAAERPLRRAIFSDRADGPFVDRQLLWLWHGRGAAGAARTGGGLAALHHHLHLRGQCRGSWRGEWRDAPAAARRLLTGGLAVLLAAVALIATSGAFT